MAAEKNLKIGPLKIEKAEVKGKEVLFLKFLDLGA